MYIGTSLGRCMYSILSGEMSIDDVLVIITRTKSSTYEKFLDVVKEYYSYGNPYAPNAEQYDLCTWSEEDVHDLAHELWHSGRIHQPRNFSHGKQDVAASIRDKLWVEIVSPEWLSNPLINESFQQFKVLATLAK